MNSTRSRVLRWTLLAFAFVILTTQTTGRAQLPTPSLPFARGFLVTGDYAIGGVDLREAEHPIQDGFSTAPIPMGDVPNNADIIGAYLFWETVTTGGEAWQTEGAGVKFRGFEIDITNPLSVHRTALASAGAACFGSGSLVMNMFRADVLRFLPVKVDSAGKPTGKRLVNTSDLTAQGLGPHTVTLPVRDGNGIPESAGASLVVVYRNPSPNAPLKKVIIHDGNAIKPDLSTPLDLTIRGFYGAFADGTAGRARISYIVSSGQPNSNLQFSFRGADTSSAQVIATAPFTSGPASQRWWANVTQDVSSLMQPGVNSSPYGEYVRTSIGHFPTTGSYDCLAAGAVVFSTDVTDADADGLPDALENATTPLLDADGTQLPNLNAMGAGHQPGVGNQPDVMIEVNAMWAPPGTAYGSPAAPYPGTTAATNFRKIDDNGHHHMPTPYVLKKVADAFTARGIRVHFDVGDLTAYRNLAHLGNLEDPAHPGVVIHSDFVDDYTSHEADQYLITTEARGGEVIREVACDPGTVDKPKPACHFPDYPGAVTWKLGMQAARDAPVHAVTGEELADVTTWDGVRRRFDPARRGLFKYLLYSHSRGNPQSLPCLVDGAPGPYNNAADLGVNDDTPSCGVDNPDFDPLGYHVPTSASGVAELPGGHFMVSLGFWDEFVGRPFARASTTFHELGHTLGLLHGGPETERTDELGGWRFGGVAWGNPSSLNAIEPNCKPNYFSSMSYLFQIHGLFDDLDQIHLDYSWTSRNGINESALPDSQLLPTPVAPAPLYQPAWFAPSTSPLALSLGVTEAKRFCSGQPFSGTAPNPHLSRVHADSSLAAVDWNGDGLINDGNGQDVNADNALGQFGGFNDWDNIRLNQTGAIVNGVTAGSAEGVFFDNSGVFFDNSGVFFDNSGVWFDNAGGVFFDNSGVFFDNAGGVWFDNSGVWFDNAGGVWFDNAGGVFFDNAGGVFFDNSGVFFDNAGGVFFDNSGVEMTFEEAKSFGRGRPHRTASCVVDEQTNKPVNPQPDPRVCSTTQPNDAAYHRIEVQFEQLQVGGVDAYQVERRGLDALPNTPDAAFGVAGTVAAHLVRFTDFAELAHGQQYIYRVRGLSGDEFGNSGWSKSIAETAVNLAPVAQSDAYQLDAAALQVAAPGVLANDTVDVDSPPTSRRLFNVTSGPSNGSLVWNADGSFIYTPNAGFVGVDTFTYTADNGAWSGNPAVGLSAPSNEATVEITVLPNDPPLCPSEVSVITGGETTVTCSDPEGGTLTVSGADLGTVSSVNNGAFTYRATSPNVGPDVLTVSDGRSTTTMTVRVIYRFVNVQNLPPTKAQKTGSVVPLRWQWTNASGVVLNTANAGTRVRAYTCAATGVPVELIGEFTPSQPGSGNSFSFNSGTWSFNWKLQYITATGVLENLPLGNYVVQVKSDVSGQLDPNAVHTCGSTTLQGAKITVVK